MKIKVKILKNDTDWEYTFVNAGGGKRVMSPF